MKIFVARLLCAAMQAQNGEVKSATLANGMKAKPCMNNVGLIAWWATRAIG